MKILIAGGGTGGHIYPALSIAKEFRRNGKQVIMVGRKGSIEEKIYEENNFQVRIIHSALLDFTPLKISRFLINATRGVFDAANIIMQEKPDAVIGAGGYVSAPVLLAAYLMRKKYFIYEQNIIPGRTNKIFGRGAENVFLGFPDTYHFFDAEKVLFTGNPVRREIFLADRKQSLEFFGFSDKKRVLLVFGGSGGARKLNFIFTKIAKTLIDKYGLQIIFITGKMAFEETKKLLGSEMKELVLLPYLNHMEYALKAADFALVRGGAMTLSELVHSRLPALIVPFPYARDNHQLKNALFLKDKGCVDVVEEKNLLPDLLLKKLFYYFEHIDIIKNKMDCCANFLPSDSAMLIYEKVMEKLNG